MNASVTTKVLDLLGAFTAEQPELTLTQLSDRTRLPPPTVHRLTGELLSWGALEREPRGPFRIGLRLWEVASLAPRVWACATRHAVPGGPLRGDPAERPARGPRRS